MFTPRYFSRHYWAGHYWPHGAAAPPVLMTWIAGTVNGAPVNLVPFNGWRGLPNTTPLVLNTDLTAVLLPAAEPFGLTIDPERTNLLPASDPFGLTIDPERTCLTS